MAAAARAAHLLVVEQPPRFAETLAETILGERAGALLAHHRLHGGHPILAGARAAVVTRSRYTEDHLARLAARGVDQYVLLGAGLDTFACRADLARRVRLFEVDRPATQEWKRERLRAAGLRTPANVSFVPFDFAEGGAASLLERLSSAGLDIRRRVLVGWLGVTTYLTEEAVSRTLTALSGLAPGSEIVWDHMLPAPLRDAAGAEYAEAVGATAAEGGEPWTYCPTPRETVRCVRAAGLEPVEHVGQHDVLGGALRDRSDALRPTALAVLTRARVPAR
jgi:methyltransferase (TIGR00027 family)